MEPKNFIIPTIIMFLGLLVVLFALHLVLDISIFEWQLETSGNHKENELARESASYYNISLAGKH